VVLHLSDKKKVHFSSLLPFSFWSIKKLQIPKGLPAPVEIDLDYEKALEAIFSGVRRISEWYCTYQIKK